MRLLGVESGGGVTEKYWLHTGDDGKDRITLETIQDADPVFQYVKRKALEPKGKDLRYKATILHTQLDRLARTSAIQWGISPKEAFAEIMIGKTDRAQKAMRILTDSRDFSKLQVRSYGA